MATKKEESKKTVKKATTTKKNNTKKVTKKVEPKKIVEVKEEKNRNNIFKIILSKLKVFFNRPTPIIVVLIAIIIGLLAFIGNFHNGNAIGVGELDAKDLYVSNLHYFINDDMNYFYAAPAVYTGEDKTVYVYQIGYFVETGDGKLVEFATRSNKVDKGTSLSKAVSELSSWNFGELNNNKYLFSKDVILNINKLHFVISASSKADSDEADIYIDEKVNISKISK